MRKMIKNVGKLFIVSAMMVAIVGCSPEDGSDKTTQATTAAKTTTETTTEKKQEETTTADKATETTEATTMEGAEVNPDEGGRILIAYTKDGTEVNLKEAGDDTWVTDNGDCYYRGDDDILRARGLDDLYITNPAEQAFIKYDS